MLVKNAVEKFLKDLSVGHSALTVRSYRTALRHLVAFAEVWDVGEDHHLTSQFGVEFARHLADRDLAASSRAAYVNAVMQFYRWLALEGTILDSEVKMFAERIKGGRFTHVPRDNVPDIPSEGAIEAIMDRAMTDPGGTLRQNLCRLRNIALLFALRVTAARVSEIVNLRRRDLHEGDRLAIVNGKGGKERAIFWTDSAWNHLMRYLDLRDGAGKSNGEIGDRPVFTRHDRTGNGDHLPLSTGAVRKMIDDLAYQAGVIERVTPHMLRHRAATAILSQTGNLAATQDILGHANPTTTRRYARLAVAQLRQAHDQAANGL